jgi:hypothetical protein
MFATGGHQLGKLANSFGAGNIVALATGFGAQGRFRNPHLGGSCARPELPRRDADQTLEVMAELALIRKAGADRNLCQGEIGSCLQELLGPLDPAHDNVLVRRQPGGPLELPREVVGAEAGDRGHLLQGRGGVEVLLDVLDYGAEPPPRQRAIPPALSLAGRREGTNSPSLRSIRRC